MSESVSDETENLAKPLDLVWGAKNIAKIIQRSERQTSYLLETGALKAAKKKSGRWVVSRAALEAEFSA